MTIEYKPLKDIKPYVNNAKLHPKEQVEQIKRSIQEFGFNDPIAIDEHNVIIEGHGRFIAVKELGYTEVPVIQLSHLTEAQKRAYIIAHNKLTLNSDFDIDLIIKELEDIKFDIDITLTGFDDIDTLLNIEPDEVVEDDFEVEVPTEPKSKLGDLWLLDNHRVLCGDSTDDDTVKRLIDGNTIDVVFTDPPYNVSFNGRSGNFDVIINDNLSTKDFEIFIKRVIEVIKGINPKAYYIWCNWKFYGVLQENIDYNACIVWAKNNFGLGRGYRHQHEFCLFGGHIHKDITNESDLWEVKKDTKYLHPTQKPVELSHRALTNSTQKGDKVLDLFGGSGSTLIGIEQLKLNGFIMELDPKYIDVIVHRYKAFKDDANIRLIRDGNTYTYDEIFGGDV
jgi:DNA modification methylase